jgi:hypothetical protein
MTAFLYVVHRFTHRLQCVDRWIGGGLSAQQSGMDGLYKGKKKAAAVEGCYVSPQGEGDSG